MVDYTFPEGREGRGKRVLCLFSPGSGKPSVIRRLGAEATCLVCWNKSQDQGGWSWAGGVEAMDGGEWKVMRPRGHGGRS